MTIFGRIAKRPSSIPFLLFGVGIIFFGLGVYNPVPEGQIDKFFALGVAFFASGILIGFIQALTRRRKL